MNTLSAQAWPQKSPQTYLKKFHEMLESARAFDNSDTLDEDSRYDRVTFRDGSEVAYIDCDPGVPKVVLQKSSSVGEGPNQEERVDETAMSMSGIGKFLSVQESSKTQGETTWERSLLIDIKSGAIITYKPGLQDWFERS